MYPTYQLQRAWHKGYIGEVLVRCNKENELILPDALLSLKAFELSLPTSKATMSLSNPKYNVTCFLFPLTFPSVIEI